MEIRRYRPGDAAVVDEIYDKHHQGTFSRPNLSHLLSAAVIEKDSKIVGFGCMEVILEAVMIVDMDLPVRDRAEILNQLLDAARFIAKDKTFDRFYVFPSDEHFKDVLVNKFKMKTCSPILSCELDGPEGDNNGQ